MLANYLPRREALSSKSSGGLGAARGCTHADGRLILIFGMTGTTGRMSSFLRAIAEHAATLVSSSVLMVWPAAQGRQVRVRDPVSAMLTAGGWFDDTTPRCVNEASGWPQMSPGSARLARTVEARSPMVLTANRQISVSGSAAWARRRR